MFAERLLLALRAIASVGEAALVHPNAHGVGLGAAHFGCHGAFLAHDIGDSPLRGIGLSALKGAIPGEPANGVLVQDARGRLNHAEVLHTQPFSSKH